MKDIKFKTLMHCGKYVDINLLEKGIYSCSKPFIYSKDETIENLIDQIKNLKDKMGLMFISKKYIDNLKKCQLVNIFIIEEER